MEGLLYNLVGRRLTDVLVYSKVCFAR